MLAAREKFDSTEPRTSRRSSSWRLAFIKNETAKIRAALEKEEITREEAERELEKLKNFARGSFLSFL